MPPAREDVLSPKGRAAPFPISDAAAEATAPSFTTGVGRHLQPDTSTFEGFDDTAPSTLSALAATHLVTCPIRVPPGSTQPFVADLEGELDVAIKGAVEGWCQPADFSDPESVAAAENATLRLAICVQVEDGASWRSLKCDAGKLTGTSPNLHLNVNAAPLCEPGSPRYRLVVTDSVTGAGKEPPVGDAGCVDTTFVAVQRSGGVASHCRARPGYV
jgi:hypothetical protein